MKHFLDKATSGKKISLVGNLQPNFFNEDKVDFIIEDFSFDE